jgi:hypothetical protein
VRIKVYNSYSLAKSQLSRHFKEVLVLGQESVGTLQSHVYVGLAGNVAGIRLVSLSFQNFPQNGPDLELGHVQLPAGLCQVRLLVGQEEVLHS